MTLADLRPHLTFQVLTGTDQCTFTGGYTSDLLSDVMANAREGDILITIQAHRNAVAVASHVDAPAMMICSNRAIPPDVIDAAAEHNVTVCRTAENQFTVSGIIYSLLT